MNEAHIGSNLDDFLEEEGLLAEAEAVAVKRVVAFQLAKLYGRTAHNKSGDGAANENQSRGGRQTLEP